MPKGEADLKLAGIRFRYFDRPQCVEIKFEKVSSIKRTELGISFSSFSRKLDSNGNVIVDKKAEQTPASDVLKPAPEE